MTNIIFDTNAARDFVSGVKIEELEQYAKDAAAEFDKKGVKLWVSPIVIQELLYHLVCIAESMEKKDEIGNIENESANLNNSNEDER